MCCALLLHVYPGLTLEGLRDLTQDQFNELMAKVGPVLSLTSPYSDDSTDEGSGHEEHVPPHAQKALASFRKAEVERRNTSLQLTEIDNRYRKNLKG